MIGLLQRVSRAAVIVDGRTIADGAVGPMTKRISALYAQLTAREGVQVV